MALNRVWEPISIGRVTVLNRVARTAHCLSLSRQPPGEDFLAYHLARARAGVGLNILEAASVHSSAALGYAVDDTAMASFDRLMKLVRPHGMTVFQQLWHGGHHSLGKDGEIPWSASAVASPALGLVPLPMKRDQISEVVASYGEAARRCRDSGLDGVEVQCGHGYLIHQFLSPLTNHRTDEYGGALPGRAKFLYEVLEAVRNAVGPDYPVAVRMSASFAEGGVTAIEMAAVAAELERRRLIDCLDLSCSDYFVVAAQAGIMTFPTGYQLASNMAIRAAVRLPRIVTGRFRTLEEAEEVLKTGEAELVSLVRAQIADPELVSKTRDNRATDVRPCIACNQGCVGGLMTFGRTQCTVNPAAGWEATLDETLIVRAKQPKKVMVVGGGPAGLEAARVAALAGHRVILCEAAPHLGGKLNLAKRAPALHIFSDLTDWLQRQVYALGVDVRTSTYVEAAEVRSEAPDVLIIATGAAPSSDGAQTVAPGEQIWGFNLPHVYDPAGLLAAPDQKLKARSALVFDDTGRYDAIAAAEYLQQRGTKIIFATSSLAFGAKLAGTFRDQEALGRLSRGDFSLALRQQLIKITPSRATIRTIGSPDAIEHEIDLVVIANVGTPLRQLAYEFQGTSTDVCVVGDALSPRDLFAAIHEGHRSTRSVKPL